MTTLPHVFGLVRVAVSGTNSGKPWANVYHHQVTLSGSPHQPNQAGVDAIVGKYMGAYVAHYLTQMTTACHVKQVVAVDLSSDTGLTSIVTEDHPGLIGSSPTPPETGYLINWAIGRRYRGGHPRSYLPGCSEPDINDDGTIASGRVTSVTSAASAFLTDVNTGAVGDGDAGFLAVPHYFKGKVLQLDPTVDPVLSGACNAIIGVQRRRLRR